MVRSSLFSAIVSLLLVGPSHGFSPSTPSPSTTTTRLNGFGDAFKNAFANDDDLGARKNEGLSGGPNYNESVTMNGKAVPGCVVGQKLTVVGGKARVKIPVNCQAGDCGTCVVKMNGRKVKACQTQVPKGKCNIQTL
ncbi:unnamed protein product [Pseudo-nitzschia multistriata]|uniref:2Fe-2S ferredoxin-type domain-containing protein n=1 Tax=Pseudo-nitzschia multistriata TaxID=183589 RepID=A0A448YZS5_9STRA|nr:unnamed protein product [Pseudo-nitzschia multistriata]